MTRYLLFVIFVNILSAEQAAAKETVISKLNLLALLVISKNISYKVMLEDILIAVLRETLTKRTT